MRALFLFFFKLKKIFYGKKKKKKMEKKGARAVVVSGAIALLVAGIVFLLLKWRPVAIDVSSGSGSGSWLASLGIGTQGPMALENPAYAGLDESFGPTGTVAPGPSAPIVMPVQTIQFGDLPSIFPEDEFGVPIGEAQFATPARAKGFDDTAAALKDGAFSDERVMPSLSTKNGGMLSTLDVRGDYAAPVLFDPKDRTCGSCDKQCVLDGKWNQSSAQRNIDLGIVKEERRRRIVFADE